MSLRRSGTPAGSRASRMGRSIPRPPRRRAGRRSGTFRSPQGSRSRTMAGGTSPRRTVSTSDKPAITRTVPWFDRKVGANLNAKYRALNLDVFYAKTEAPHLTNSTATTSWGRYGVSNATQAMVDLGYTRKFSTRWTSSLHATYNHFLEPSDFGEIGYRDDPVEQLPRGMGERSVGHRQGQCRVRRECLEAHRKLLRGDVRLVWRAVLQPQQLHRRLRRPTIGRSRASS